MGTQKRTGFTLVELMVAMALTLFVMVILTQAFVTALETFAAMKGIGDMQQNLRTAVVVLRNDLIQDHFEGKRRLSDLDANGAPLILGANQKLQNGFFVVRQSSAWVAAGSATNATPYVNEGADANGLASFRANDQMLYMTVKRRGNRKENMFTATLLDPPNGANISLFFGQKTAYNMTSADLPYNTWVPPYSAGSAAGFYASQWAEVCYYLVRTGSTEEPNNPASTLGTPTFALYRAQFVMTPDGGTTTTGVSSVYKTPGYSAANLGTLATTIFGGMSTNPMPFGAPTNLMFYSPADAATGMRVIPNVAAFTPPALPDDPSADPRFASHSNHVLSSVLSFHIRVMPTGGLNFVDVTSLTGAVPGIYDTVNLGNAGYANTGLKAIQITLRVWDPSSRQSRQMTIVQDL